VDDSGVEDRERTKDGGMLANCLTRSEVNGKVVRGGRDKGVAVTVVVQEPALDGQQNKKASGSGLRTGSGSTDDGLTMKKTGTSSKVAKSRKSGTSRSTDGRSATKKS
jgi:hypothetical protein